MSWKVNEKVIDYTDCRSAANPDQKCSDLTNTTVGCGCICNINFTLDSDYTVNIFE